MIVRRHLNFKKVFRFYWKSIVTLILLSTVVYIIYEIYGNKDLAISTIPASILGVAISFLIGFRVNSAYERWWEARKIWDMISNESISYGREIITLISPFFNNVVDKNEIENIKKELIKNQIGFLYALKRTLRKQDVFEEIQDFFTKEELDFLKIQYNIPSAILQLQSNKIQKIYEKKYTDDFRHIQFDSRIALLTNYMGNCFRIKDTVFPRQYSYYSTLFTRIYAYLLPFILVQETGILIIPFTLFIGFIFFALDGIASVIENPFENTLNDTPMNTIVRDVEIVLLQMVGEKNIPNPLKPTEGYLY